MQYTVGELCKSIQETIVTQFNEKVRVSGEISNLKNSNGHLFFTLKDEEAGLSVAFWNYFKKDNQKLKNGDNVDVTGKIGMYVKNGNCNLIASKIEVDGIGAIHSEYLKLKETCEKNNYFSKKRPFPAKLERIGIITALDGAALQDILFVLKKSGFTGKIIIKKSYVQGVQCPSSVCSAIKELEEWTDGKKKLDLILITRGGGSFEDLMGYSDVKVIKTLYECPIFTISAIGHEIDFMLSDFAADIRAPTPSIAGEIISSEYKKRHNVNEFEIFLDQQKKKIDSQMLMYKMSLEKNKKILVNPCDRINDTIKKNNDNLKELHSSCLHKIVKYSHLLKELSLKLENHNVDAKINSGLAIVTRKGVVYDSVDELKEGKKMKIKLKNGYFYATINKVVKDGKSKQEITKKND